MHRTISLLILAAACAGCATKPLSSLQVASNEAAVIGRVRIVFNGDDVTDGSLLLFNERKWGTYTYKVPSDGWIITKLPLGSASIARISFAKFMQGNFFYDFTPEQTGFNLGSSQNVYYMGDLVVDWTGRGFKPSMLFGPAGAIVDQMSSDGTPKMAVNDNRAAAMQELTARFGPGTHLAFSLVGRSPPTSAVPPGVPLPTRLPSPPAQPLPQSGVPILAPPAGQ
jgi:hypothetical protein